MIFATSKPIEKYTYTGEGMTVGLYETYKDRPHVLYLVMALTTIPYEYELGDPAQGLAQLGQPLEKLFEETLDYEPKIKNSDGQLTVSIRELIDSVEDPIQFYESVHAFDPVMFEELPINKEFTKVTGGAMRAIMGARAAVWGLSLHSGSTVRGKVKDTGKITKVNFGTSQGSRVTAEMKEAHIFLKETLGYATKTKIH